MEELKESIKKSVNNRLTMLEKAEEQLLKDIKKYEYGSDCFDAKARQRMRNNLYNAKVSLDNIIDRKLHLLKELRDLELE